MSKVYICKKENCLYHMECKFTENDIENYKNGLTPVICLGGEDVKLNDLKMVSKNNG